MAVQLAVWPYMQSRTVRHFFHPLLMLMVMLLPGLLLSGATRAC